MLVALDDANLRLRIFFATPRAQWPISHQGEVTSPSDWQIDSVMVVRGRLRAGDSRLTRLP
jgi:hypothetical protein